MPFRRLERVKAGRLKLACLEMVVGNIARRLTQRLACPGQLRVPFSLPGPWDRGSDVLKSRFLNKPRPVRSRLSQPAVVEETIEPLGRRTSGEQNRHRKLGSEQSSLFQGLSDGD
jgi:hypothetical protein